MASSKSEQVFSVAGNVVTQKWACLTPEEVESIVKANLGLFKRDMGFQNKWEVNVWLIDLFLFASQNQLLLVRVEY